MFNRRRIIQTTVGNYLVPAAMRPDLARKLVEDDAFAHLWLCHGNDQKCPDGCDGRSVDSARQALYLQIDRVWP